MHLVICPEATNGLNPPPPAAPALFDTAVRLPNELPRFSMAAMMVSIYHKVSQLIFPNSHDNTWRRANVPAVPQSPNPALKTVLPLFKSATAASASLYTLLAPLTIFGAGSRFDPTFACCCSLLHPVLLNCRASGARTTLRCVLAPAAATKSALRLELARQSAGILLVAIFAYVYKETQPGKGQYIRIESC